ncbi:Lar family restriction alleviation protein [Vibrio sp. YQ_11]|uniref:Lar family restriction alleviation protein n=1 Tax=unclassified Vibrio TaxID=2614977 RepID=UPI00370C5367
MSDKVVAIQPVFGTRKPDDGGLPLKPCPFCGASPTLDQDCDETWYVACINKRCFVSPITKPFGARRQAAIAWNNRQEI